MGQALGSTLAEAAFNTLIGMGTVFIVLMIISFIIWLFKFIGIAEKKAAAKKENQTAVPLTDPGSKPVIEEKKELKDDRELVAVIAAAIAAYEGTDPDGIIVRSVRRVRRKTENVRG